MKTRMYRIECRTGCSCCSNENHYRGFYIDKRAAEFRVMRFHETKLLSSQYALSGKYRVQEVEAEIRGDILFFESCCSELGHWCRISHVFDVNEDGYLLDADGNLLSDDHDEHDWDFLYWRGY